MATKALTAVVSRARRPIALAEQAPLNLCDWRELLTRQEIEPIWQRLSALVRLTLPDRASEHDRITQEVFLHLLSSNRIDMYLERNYSGEKIRRDLKTLINGTRKRD